MPTGDSSVEPNVITEKRFVLSKEPFVKERMEAVKQVVDDIKSVHPEVLSFCMFGSMTSGRANPDSDIDGYLFVDASKTAEKNSKAPADILETTKPEEGSIRTYFVPEVENEYSGTMRQELIGRLNLTPEQVQHVRVRPISEQIISEHVEDLREQVKDLREFQTRVAEWESRNPEGSGRPIQEVIDYYEQRPKHPGFPSPSVTLQSMFHLQVGNGIQPYRTHLINQLSGMGKEGEEVWKAIIQGTEMMESHLQTDTGKLYPRTLENAKKMYATPEGVGQPSEQGPQDLDRRRLVLEILKTGLKSSRTLHDEGVDSRGSVDPTDNEYVYGRQFKPENSYRSTEFFQRAVDQALYKTSNSILPVVAEQQGETTGEVDLYEATKEQKSEIEKRIDSSMLVVYRGQEGDEFYTRTDENLGPENILFVLMPDSVLSGLPTKDLAETGVRVVRVTNKIKKKLYSGDEITVPDYESEIKKILQESGASLWIHGVRLPPENGANPS